jgi:hypothetical protein
MTPFVEERAAGDAVKLAQVGTADDLLLHLCSLAR